jgi:uncharacterized protein (DUF302 family)
MKKKLDIDFRDYRILGACNPPLAHQALIADDKIGTMLPCNVIVQDLGDGRIEVAAIDSIPRAAKFGGTIWSLGNSFSVMRKDCPQLPERELL